MAGIHKAVVDTGPLFSVLVLKYSQTLEPRAATAIIERNRIPQYLGSSNQQISMVHLFDGIRIILTSSHVVGELQGLQRLKGASLREFWLFAMSWLSLKGLDERLTRLLDLNGNTRSRTNHLSDWPHRRRRNRLKSAARRSVTTRKLT